MRRYFNNRDRMDYYRPHENELTSEVLAEVRQVYLGVAGGYHIWGVDCEAILGNHVDLDFTNGGNGGRYRYIPVEELWVDMTYSPSRVAHTLVHEGIEAPLMIVHGLHYNQAHDIANIHEDLVIQAIRRKDLTLQNMEQAIDFVDIWLTKAIPTLLALPLKKTAVEEQTLTQ